jgi:sulfite exporter TauE/SafE
MMKLAAEGFSLGLSMGGFCAIACGPFLVPYLLNTGIAGADGAWAKARVFGEFLLGRLVSYLLSGLAAGLAGLAVNDLAPAWVKSLFLIISAALLLAYSFWSLRRDIRLCPLEKPARLARGLPFATGLLLGFNLCPPFAVGLVRVFGLGNLFESLSYFFFLFLGTTIFLIPLPLVASWLRRDFFRRMGVYLGLLAGIWFILQGVLLLL